jgi:hypothetical protein
MTEAEAGDKKQEPDQSLFVRCNHGDKGKWVRAAKGAKLTDWVIQTLNEAAKAQNKERELNDVTDRNKNG